MGNYYEGTLSFGLKKDFNNVILSDLLKLKNLRGSEKQDILNELSSMILQSKWLQHPYWNRPIIDIEKVYKLDDSEYFSFSIDDNLEDIDEKDKLEFSYYVVNVRFCMKGYRIEGIDLGESIYEYLLPYIDKNIYPDIEEGGLIGEIKDEDGYYFKRFYVDKNNFQKTLKNREYICKGCLKQKENEYLCKNYDFCKRAYQIGKESKK